MDNRRLVYGVLLAVALVLLWQPALIWIGDHFFDMKAVRPPTTQSVAEGPTTAPTQEAGVAQAAPPTPGVAAASTSTSGLAVALEAGGAPVTIGSATPNDPQYRIAVTISPQGAGVDSVVLNQFKRTAEGKEPFVFEQPYAGHESVSRPLATRTIHIDNTPVELSSANWKLESSDNSSATYVSTISRDGKPVLRVRKKLQVFAASDQGGGYEMEVVKTLENLSDQRVKVRMAYNGPTLPPKEQEQGGDRQVLAGFNVKNSLLVNHNMVEEFTKDKPSHSYAKDDSGNPVLWAGTSSFYFNALVRPLEGIDPNSMQNSIAAVTATVLDPAQHSVVMTFETVEKSIGAGQTLTHADRAYFGPRQRKLLEGDYYAALPRAFDQTLVLTSGPCGYCTFQWLISLLVKLLGGLHWIFGGFMGHGDWGLAIIGLVVIVRVILHPITKRSQISMAKMSKMGPEMERLRKKYGDNKDELNKAMWQMQKEQGLGPYLGCLPMFMQMPIWLALWQALQTTFELRHASFLWGFTWIHDLSKPDHLLEWTPVPFLFWTFSGLNVLPLLMGVVFWLQMKFQPRPATMTPEQEQQQKMMMVIMPFLFPLMLYSGPSGLNLYILTSTAIGIVESKIVRDHIKQREEAEKAGRVLVDAKPTRASKQAQQGKVEKKKRTGLAGWWDNLLAQAEQVRRDAEKRGK